MHALHISTELIPPPTAHIILFFIFSKTIIGAHTKENKAQGPALTP